MSPVRTISMPSIVFVLTFIYKNMFLIFFCNIFRPTTDWCENATSNAVPFYDSDQSHLYSCQHYRAQDRLTARSTWMLVVCILFLFWFSEYKITEFFHTFLLFLSFKRTYNVFGNNFHAWYFTNTYQFHMKPLIWYDLSDDHLWRLW